MQASTIAASLNPFAAATTGQGEGVSTGAAGLLQAVGGQPGEAQTTDAGFGDVLTGALAAAAGIALPVQPTAPAAPNIDGAAVHADVLASAAPGLVAASVAGAETAAEDNLPAGQADFADSADPRSFVALADETALRPQDPTAKTGVPAAGMTAPANVPAAPAHEASTADAAVALAAKAATEASPEDGGPQPPAAPVQAHASAQPQAQVMTAAAHAPGLVKPAPAAAPKPDAKDKAQPLEEARGGSRAAASAPTEAGAKSTQEAVTQFAVAAPDTVEADDAPPAKGAPEAAPAPAALAAAEARPLTPGMADAPRATTQTVALLAAQIAQKIDGRTTRFDVQLDPHGLGRVDVRVEIGPRGDISAALSFDNPQAASELRGRAGDLHAALEQAGFDLSKTSLSFNSGGQGNHGLWDQQKEQHHGRAWQGRAFTDLSDTPEAAPAPVRLRATSGVDVRI